MRSRRFLAYTVIFGGIALVLFIFGVTESRTIGFTGLSRLGADLSIFHRDPVRFNRLHPVPSQ